MKWLSYHPRFTAWLLLIGSPILLPLVYLRELKLEVWEEVKEITKESWDKSMEFYRNWPSDTHKALAQLRKTYEKKDNDNA